MTAFGSEMSSYVSVALVTAAVVFSVPPESIGFRAEPVRTETVPSCAFVTLDAQAEAAFLRKAKETWRKSGGSRIYADLVFAELPTEAPEAILPVSARPSLAVPFVAERGRTPFLPSLRAGSPDRIAPEPAPDVQAFSREELLKID